MKRGTSTTNEDDVSVNVKDEDIFKIIDVLSKSINRKGYWLRTAKKLKECLIKEMIQQTTKNIFMETIEKLVANEQKDQISSVISAEIELFELIQSYKIPLLQPESLIQTRYSQIKQMKGLLSEDGFEYSKSITNLIEDINSTSNTLKQAQIESGEHFDKSHILSEQVSNKFTLSLKIVNDELENKPMKRTWAKPSTKPLLKVCKEKPQLWSDEQKEIIITMERLISNESAEKEKRTPYEEAIDKWNKAEIRMNK